MMALVALSIFDELADVVEVGDHPPPGMTFTSGGSWPMVFSRPSNQYPDAATALMLDVGEAASGRESSPIWTTLDFGKKTMTSPSVWPEGKWRARMSSPLTWTETS